MEALLQDFNIGGTSTGHCNENHVTPVRGDAIVYIRTSGVFRLAKGPRMVSRGDMALDKTLFVRR